MPLVSGLCTTPAQVIGKGLAEFLAPLANGFVGDEDPPNHHHLLDVTVTQTEAEVEPHTVTADLSRETVTTVQCSGRAHGFSSTTLALVRQHAVKFDNTVRRARSLSPAPGVAEDT